MKQSTKNILKRTIIPLILILLYLVGIAIVSLKAEPSPDAVIDLTSNFGFFYLLMIILTAPPLLMIASVIFWIAEFIIFKLHKSSLKAFIIASAVCVTVFLIGLFTYIFLTLHIL